MKTVSPSRLYQPSARLLSLSLSLSLSLFIQPNCYCAPRKPRADSWSMLVIFTPITISGIDSMHTVFTEIGENASIQRQRITPLTPCSALTRA
jgi:hypothetical protein